MVQLSHAYMTTGKTIALTRQTFVGKVMSLLFNMLSMFVIAFISREGKCPSSPSSSWVPVLLILILQTKQRVLVPVADDSSNRDFKVVPLETPNCTKGECKGEGRMVVKGQRSSIFHKGLRNDGFSSGASAASPRPPVTHAVGTGHWKRVSWPLFHRLLRGPHPGEGLSHPLLCLHMGEGV